MGEEEEGAVWFENRLFTYANVVRSRLEYVEGDYAIVQSPDFATLFVLSREQNLTTAEIDVGSKRTRSSPGSIRPGQDANLSGV